MLARADNVTQTALNWAGKMECTGTRIGKEAYRGLNDAFRGKADGGVEPCRVLGRQVGFGGIGDGDGAFEFVHRVGPGCA